MTGNTTAARNGNLRTVSKLLLVTVAMFGFGFAMVPIYDVLCELTGLNGKPAAGPAVETDGGVDRARLVTVEFVAMVNGGVPWEFRPKVDRLQVHPGETRQVSFYARNLREVAQVAQAVPSVAPGQAARYFRKTECFCFTRQEFLAGEGRDMPLVFSLDPDLPADIHTVTLSYTFFELQDQAASTAVDSSNPGGEGA